MTMACPHCGGGRFFGPASIYDCQGTDHPYVQCCKCQRLVLVRELEEVGDADENAPA
jgi:hypothetical protein